MMEPLVRALFFQGAATYEHPIEGGSGFAERVCEGRDRGIRRAGACGQLDLDTRLLRHPLSYEIYSAQFDGLPQYALDYIYSRIVEVLQGRDTTGISAGIPAGGAQGHHRNPHRHQAGVGGAAEAGMNRG